MYLKDCSISYLNGGTALHPFVKDYSTAIEILNEYGDHIKIIQKNHPAIETFKGTPISDRDYRLAIARALSLKSQIRNTNN